MSNKNRRTATQNSLEKYGFNSSKQKLVPHPIEKGSYTIKEGIDPSLVTGDDGLPYTGWKWVPVKNRNTGVYRYINNGIIEQPGFTSATDGTPFSRGGAGVYENLFKGGKAIVDFVVDSEADRRFRQQEVMADAIDYTGQVWNNRVSPFLSAINQRFTPSAEDPNKSVSQVNKEKERTSVDAANDILLKWKGGQ